MLYSLLNGEFSLQTALMNILAVSVIVFLVMPLHEFAHGFIAYKLGDKTAKNMGRLKFSPAAHIDPVGALMILLVGFGWAKPVPVNPRYFKNPKVGMALTALAGPVSNLLAALVGGLFVNGSVALVYNVALSDVMFTVVDLLFTFFSYFLAVNISLAVFNLIPIPPLDGSKILFAFLPDKLVYKAYQYERHFNTILIFLIAFGALTGPLDFARNILTQLIIKVTSLPFAGLY
ncbi:MAG: site-2 protease family protein [Acutalibacteraceae bacterium]|nr:site-2 protease family protein [Acutalibacteraceae bacterium]